MNTQERVNQALFGKTELKSEKVELDISTEIQKGEKILNQIKNTSKGYSSAFENTIKTLDRLASDLDTGGIENTTIKPAEQLIKDLQRAKLTDIQLYKELEFFTRAFKSEISGIQRIERALINITEARI